MIDAPPDARDEIGRSRQAISTGASVEDSLGFETLDAWSPLWSAVQLSLNSQYKTQGQHSLQLSNLGWAEVESRRFLKSELDLGVASVLVRYDLRLPKRPVNPWWLGATQLYIDCPSAGLQNQYIGQVELTGKSSGKFNRIEFSLPPEVTNALQVEYDDLSIRIVVNAPYGSAPHQLDKLRFAVACGDGDELPLSAACDRVENCANGGDEVGCPEFDCGDGSSVLASFRCDDSIQCANGADELGCPGGFACADASRVVSPGVVCDGVAQCDDASDEDDCPAFDCGDGQQVLESQRCDGAQHCSSGADEVDCDDFECASGQVILQRFVCDGRRNCRDGSDEVGCAGFESCQDGSQGVPKSQLCDTRLSCADGSDERNCAGFVPCADGSMGVQLAAWCNGFPDCLDGSDESDEGCAVPNW